VRCEQAGQADDAMAMLEETPASAHTYDDRYWEPEVHRLKGELLAPISDWCTEGFGTADLQEAGALLGELQG
jgi:hypothetical protein